MEKLASQLEPDLQVTGKYAEELVNSLLELVNINDVQSTETDSDGEMPLNEIRSNRKCLSRYVSFPSPRKMISKSSSYDKEEENHESMENLPCKNQVVITKLKSAMKGGTSPRNKTVSWAPDVYDPPPTLVSHSIKRGTRQQRLSKKDKKRGKRNHSHKGNNLSKSSKDKKNKPICPTNLSSSIMMSYKLPDVGDNLGIMMSEEKVKRFGFSVSDNYCGSSFISLSDAQYPFAEAL